MESNNNMLQSNNNMLQSNNNILQNNLAEYFLKNIEHFIENEEMLKEFLQVVNSNIPLYHLIKYENINKNIKLNNINFDIMQYPPFFLKLLNKNTILKYADKFYEEAYLYLIDFIKEKDYIYYKEIENYFLYNAIYNIARSEASSNVIINNDNFINKDCFSYIQIHKTSPTPLTKEIFTKLMKNSQIISYLLKYKNIKKDIIHPDTLFILQVIAYYNLYYYKIQNKLPKKVKNFCKTINKDDLYDVLFN